MAVLNRLIDAQDLPPPEVSPRFGSAPTLGSSLLAVEDLPESKMKGDWTAPVGSGFLDWGQSLSAICWIIRPLCRCCAFDWAMPFGWIVYTACICSKGMSLLQTACRLWRDGAAIGCRSRANTTLSAPTRYTRGSSLWLGHCRIPDGEHGGFLLYTWQPQEQLPVAPADRRATLRKHHRMSLLLRCPPVQ